MKITKITIKNFRNITETTYDLTDRVAITGKNHIGKTNTLQAISWVLTDSLLGGVNEVDSILPNHDKRLTTEVELVFDNGDKLRKTYREKWSRTRGKEGVETLQGHETLYYHNDSPIAKIGDAKDKIAELLLGEDNKLLPKKYKLDLIQTLINPLYLFSNVDYRIAREFIISLVGEINDLDVFNKFAETQIIQKDLADQNGRTDSLSKKYKNDISLVKKDIESSQVAIDVAKNKIETNQVTEEEVKEAEELKAKIKQTAFDIENERANTEQVDTLQKVANDKFKLYKEIESKWREEDSKNTKDWIDQKNVLEREINIIEDRISTFDKDIQEAQFADEDIHKKMERYNAQIEDEQNRRRTLLANYNGISLEEFDENSVEKVICPHCGEVINDGDIEKAREDFEKNKKVRISSILAQGMACKTEITRLHSLIDDCEKELGNYRVQDIDSMKLTRADLAKEIAIKRELYFSLKKRENSYEEEYKNAHEAYNKAQDECELAKTAEGKDAKEKAQAYLKSMESDLALAEATIAKNIILKDAKKDLATLETKLKTSQAKLGEIERKEIVLKAFIIDKMEMVKNSTKKVFPNLEFVLIENNIREDSYSQVCYPKILGKETPYENGSNSERILTGVAVIEDIKRTLALGSIPLVFDEGETLDSQSIKEITTDSQVITSVVNDNYSTPTAISIL